MIANINEGHLLRVVSGSYIGTGKNGQDAPNNLTFSAPPKAVVIADTTAPISSVMLFSGMPYGVIANAAPGQPSTSKLTLSWDENSVSWYGDTPAIQLNWVGSEYMYFALL